MENGWVKLHRKLTEWQWYQDSKTLHLFLHLLLTANHQPKKWRKIIVERGQLITGRLSLKEQTGISEQSIRTVFEKLKSTNEITIKSTNKYSIVTICNYNKYQDDKREINQATNQQLTNNQPTTNHKQECNNIRIKDKDINTLSSGSKKPADPRIKDFIDYAYSTCKEQKGFNLHIDGGKDGIAVKRLLSTHDIETLKKLWDQMLSSEDEFIQKAGISIGVFKSQINKLISGGKIISEYEARWNRINKSLQEDKK